MTAATWQASPAFPPLDDALAAIDWRQVLTVCLFTLALSQAIATRALPFLVRVFDSIARKVTRAQIRRLSASGISQRALAARFGVTRYAIRQALDSPAPTTTTDR